MEEKIEIDYKDKYIRLVAEFDNYKKRTIKLFGKNIKK